MRQANPPRCAAIVPRNDTKDLAVRMLSAWTVFAKSRRVLIIPLEVRISNVCS